jgi:hypothetical protein
VTPVQAPLLDPPLLLELIPLEEPLLLLPLEELVTPLEDPLLPLDPPLLDDWPEEEPLLEPASA